MFGKFAARNLIGLLVLSLPIFGAPGGALAQYQVNVSALDAVKEPSRALVLTEPFGLNVIRVQSGELLAKWSGVVADIHAEGETLARCRDAAQMCPAAAQRFLAIIAEGRARAGRARIGVINRAINLAIQPTSDLAQWGVPDRWSAPLQTLTTGRGDCEDYAIAKYVALTAAGVSADDVKLVIMRNLAAGEDHAVVAARLDDKWMVLDNRRLTLLQDIEMPSVLPLFVLDNDGVKQFAGTMMAQAPAAATAPGEGAAEPGSLGF
jgi:predicted transglutaminase-like cysteine proteinase